MSQQDVLKEIMYSSKWKYDFLKGVFDISPIIKECFNKCLGKYGDCCDLKDLVIGEINLYIASKFIYERDILDEYLKIRFQDDFLGTDYRRIIGRISNLFSRVSYSLTLDDCYNILEGNILFLQKVDSFVLGYDRSLWKQNETSLIDISRLFIEAYEEFNSCEVDINSLFKFVHEKFYPSVRGESMSLSDSIKALEEVDLVVMAKEGDVDARNELFQRNFGLIYNEAKQFLHDYNDIVDLVHDGIFGFNLAIKNFDIDKGTKFSSYCGYSVRTSILRSSSVSKGCIMTQEYDRRESKKYNEVLDDFIFENDRYPTLSEMEEVLNWGSRRVDNARRFPIKYASLEEALEVPDDYDLEEDAMNRKKSFDVDLLFDDAKITEKQREILLLRFGFFDEGESKTFAEISDDLGLTKQAVSCHYLGALQKLRNSKYTLVLASLFGNSEDLIKRLETFKNKKYVKVNSKV